MFLNKEDVLEVLNDIYTKLLDMYDLTKKESTKVYLEMIKKIIEEIEEIEEPMISDFDLKTVFNGIADSKLSEFLMEEVSEGIEPIEDKIKKQIEDAVVALSNLGRAPNKETIRKEIEEKLYGEDFIYNEEAISKLDDIVIDLADQYSMGTEDDTVDNIQSDRLINVRSLSAPEQIDIENALRPDRNLPKLPGARTHFQPEIAEASLIQDLIKLADSLDKSELHQEADVVDNLIQKISK